MTEEQRERCADELSIEASGWIKGRLAGTRGTGFRRTLELQIAIYGWLMDYGIFEEPNGK